MESGLCVPSRFTPKKAKAKGIHPPVVLDAYCIVCVFVIVIGLTKPFNCYNTWHKAGQYLHYTTNRRALYVLHHIYRLFVKWGVVLQYATQLIGTNEAQKF